MSKFDYLQISIVFNYFLYFKMEIHKPSRKQSDQNKNGFARKLRPTTNAPNPK